MGSSAEHVPQLLNPSPNGGFRTWHGELAVATVLLLGTLAITGGKPIEWLGSAAVLSGFCHAQIAERLREREALRAQPGVSCYTFLDRYFLLREALWTLYFVALGAWSALVGCFIFAVYPLWRRFWRKRRPLT